MTPLLIPRNTLPAVDVHEHFPRAGRLDTSFRLLVTGDLGDDERKCGR